MVIQIAKAAGLKVIASAGSDEKVNFMKSIGADMAFNYKTTPVSEVLTKEGPIDMYSYFISHSREFIILILSSFWDNVGGETLNHALVHSRRYARFIVSNSTSKYHSDCIKLREQECGMITTYNDVDTLTMVKNISLIIQKEIKISGFIVSSLYAKYPEFWTEFPKRVASGEFKYTEDIINGLEHAGVGIEGILRGTNSGKVIINVAL